MSEEEFTEQKAAMTGFIAGPRAAPAKDGKEKWYEKTGVRVAAIIIVVAIVLIIAVVCIIVCVTSDKPRDRTELPTEDKRDSDEFALDRGQGSRAAQYELKQSEHLTPTSKDEDQGMLPKQQDDYEAEEDEFSEERLQVPESYQTTKVKK